MQGPMLISEAYSNCGISYDKFDNSNQTIADQDKAI